MTARGGLLPQRLPPGVQERAALRGEGKDAPGSSEQPHTPMTSTMGKESCPAASHAAFPSAATAAIGASLQRAHTGEHANPIDAGSGAAHRSAGADHSPPAATEW